MAITFDQAVKLVNKVYKSNTVIYHREGSADMGQRFGMDTPVDTGHATGNWHGSINSPDLESLQRFDQSLNAGPTRKIIGEDLAGLKFKDTVYIQNAVKGEMGEGYIIQLEHGKSKQAPNGMFLVNLGNAQTVFNKAYKANT